MDNERGDTGFARFGLRVRDEPASFAEVRAAVDRVAEERGLEPEAAFDLKVATQEAVANALRQTSREPREIGVTLQADDAVVEVEVANDGGFRLAIGSDPEHGRGLPLIVALADEVEFASTGDATRVRIRKRLNHAA